MNTYTQEHRDYGFVIGLVTGTVVGAGLAIWLAPRAASELGRRVTQSVKRVGRRASEQYQEASARVGEAADDAVRRGQDVRDDVADVVARSAHEVERMATSAKSDRPREVGRHSAANHPVPVAPGG